MNHIGTIVEWDPSSHRCRVWIAGPNCGHCVEAPGHCARKRHHLTAIVPEDFSARVQVGCRAVVHSTPTGVLRGLWRVLLAPGLIGVLVLWLSWTWAERQPDPFIWHYAAFGLGAIGVLSVVASRGPYAKDQPVLVDVPGGTVQWRAWGGPETTSAPGSES